MRHTLSVRPYVPVKSWSPSISRHNTPVDPWRILRQLRFAAFQMSTYTVMASIVMAYTVMAYVVMACIVAVYIVTAFIVMVYIVMAYIVIMPI